jgi:hypothetical protein
MTTTNTSTDSPLFYFCCGLMLLCGGPAPSYIDRDSWVAFLKEAS